MMQFLDRAMARLRAWDSSIAAAALLGMVLIPFIEVLLRPIQGSGIENAPVVVQHLGLLFSLAGAVYAERTGHLTSLGSLWKEFHSPLSKKIARAFVFLSSSLLCGVLALGSHDLVMSEIESGQVIAYGVPTWVFLCALPLGFCALAIQLGQKWHDHWLIQWAGMLAVWFMVVPVNAWLIDATISTTLASFFLLCLLILGGPVFLVLALPLFTLAGLIFANTQAAQRLSQLFTAFFGSGQRGSIFAVACLCSCFTALTGGSGVTILALGGLMLPLLLKVGYPESKSIGLITSASSLGVLLAPSVPLIMYAIMARVPINTMFVAGLVPAVLMIVCLVVFGGFLRGTGRSTVSQRIFNNFPSQTFEAIPLKQALWNAKWELLAPLVAVGSLISGLATPTEGAAMTVVYALVTQWGVHRELSSQKFIHCLVQSAQIIGGILLIMGMALGLTNYLIDVGVPDMASEWVQGITQNKYVFLLALNIFLFFAGALMEIYAAIIVLVPLLLPLAMSYGIDPIHFGIIFLANLEMGFLCPPAGMNIYFASAVFKKSLKEVMQSVLPALLAIFIGTVIISWFPIWVMALPDLVFPKI